MSPSNSKLPPGFDAKLCPIRTVLDQIGDKWSLLAISELQQGTRRFSELGRAIPDISQRMLTYTLRKLERDGLVSRKVTPSIPPRVDYTITELGSSLSKPLSEMSRWAEDKRMEILAARERYEKKTARLKNKRGQL